jgi:hypothetical protein
VSGIIIRPLSFRLSEVSRITGRQGVFGKVVGYNVALVTSPRQRDKGDGHSLCPRKLDTSTETTVDP